ncbi:putative ATP-dependent RNA helicase SoYb isoform X2 [Drosophila tropicalis]
MSYVSSPQLFWYIELKELEAKAKTICQIERELISHCNRTNQLNEYKQDQHVIVEFLSWSSPKFIRGVVCQSKDKEYLVSALDYGFAIKCSAQNLWLLPKEHQIKCLNIKKGCVASVIPLNDTNWSTEALYDFDKKLEESSHLTFLTEYNNSGSTVGQLFWKSSTERTQVNAANYLLEKQYACLNTKLNVLMSLHSMSLTEYILNIDIAEINKKNKQPRLRVRNIIRLIADKDRAMNNTKTVMENCNQKYDMFLQQRNFIIPQTALKMSKVNGGRSGSYDILQSVKLTDAESTSKTSEFLVEQESAKPLNGNVKEALENKDISKINSSFGQGKIYTNSINVVKTSSLPSITDVALVHSSSNVLPMTDKQPLPFCQNIKNAMKRFNLHNIWPMQLLAWPHLMQKTGNSLLLIDNPNSGRTWCYLPALCSLVMRKMHNSRLKLGPVAIILTDLANITKFANDCSNLMQAHNTNILKVVNTSDYSQTDVCRALLDSCGILITTLNKFVNLLEIHNKNDLMLFDPNYLELFVCDDYDRLRLSNAKLLNEVLIQSRSILKFPLLRFVLISQQWHHKVFSKLIKDLAGEALILFGDHLEAAMYGGLTMETVLRRTNDKLTQLFKYVDQHKSKRILIYCKSQQELQHLTIKLTKVGHQCISEAENQQTHQLLLLTDESSHPVHLIKKNIEVLIHYSMPDSWTKFVFRFHSMMDNIDNLLVPTQNPTKVVTHLLLDQSNHHELSRLMVFFDSHGIAMDKSIRDVVVSYQQEIERKRPLCLNLLHSGKCDQKHQCTKRHHFVQSDVQGPKGPMEQSGTLVRCNVHKVYDPVHMAVRPIEFKPPGSSKWLTAPSSDSQLLMALALSMAMKSKPHLPLKIGDVCAIHKQGQYKRVRIVEIPHGRPVTVQLMDLGTELLQVKPMELLECEEKFQIAPPLAMDVRLIQIQPNGGETAKWPLEAIKWVTNSFKGLNEQEHIQIFVDFAVLDVIYASEIAIIEKCHTMRTSVYKLKLSKELLLKGYAQVQDSIDHKNLEKYKQQEQNSKPNKLTEPKENDNLEKPLENINVITPETNVNCNSRKTSRISLVLAAINKYILRTGSPVPLESAIVEKNHVEPSKVEPPVMDSTTEFFNTLIGQLNVKNSSIKNNSAQDLINNIFGTTIEKAKVKEEFENALPIPSSEKVVPDLPQFSTDHITGALKCIRIADGAVCPKVKWRQTLAHIDITFEQQVPQYELIHRGNTLCYSVVTAEPPQHCVLNLLGEVKIVSKQQHGYILHVKLAKLSLVCSWPTLLNSLYAQQHSHWLTYDTERATSPPQRMGDVLWQRYVRRLDETNDTTDDDDHQGAHHSSDDQYDAGVERCQSLFEYYYEDL